MGMRHSARNLDERARRCGRYGLAKPKRQLPVEHVPRFCGGVNMMRAPRRTRGGAVNFRIEYAPRVSGLPAFSRIERPTSPESLRPSDGARVTASDSMVRPSVHVLGTDKLAVRSPLRVRIDRAAGDARAGSAPLRPSRGGEEASAASPIYPGNPR
jgi:hypothetical protein